LWPWVSSKFYPEVALATTQELQIKTESYVSQNLPKESMPDFLNSIKETEEETYSAVSKIISDFKVHMNVIRNNEIYWFSKNL
jgi:hypothetical protein